MSTQTLYEIRDDLDALRALLTEVGGDITDEMADAAVTKWLAETGEALASKLDRYGALIRDLEAKAAARKEEADRLRSLATTDENAIKRLKDRLLWFFEDQGLPKYETTRFKFSVANNGGREPLAVTLAPEDLPDWARAVTYRADTDAIRAEIVLREQAGREPLDFAEIMPRGKHLRIR